MGLPRGVVLAIMLVFAGGVPGLLTAQARGDELGRVISPILTIDRDQLFQGTLFGQRINRDLAAASAAMAAETRDIEAALEAEELALTEQRATLPADEFRALADAFDEKVQTRRAEREAAQADLRSQIEAAQAEYFDQVGPILGALVRSRGAVMILDRRAILLTAADVDVTDEAIARIDAELGEGDMSDPTEAPAQGNTPEAATPTVDTIPAPLDVAPDTSPSADSSGQ